MRLFHRLDFQKKILLSYLVFVCILGLVASLFSYQLTSLTKDLRRHREFLLPQAFAMVEIKNHLYTKTYAIQMYISTRDYKYLQEYYRHLDSDLILQQIKKTEDNQELFAMIDQIEDLDHIFQDQVTPALRLNPLSVKHIIETEIKPRLSRLESELSSTLNRMGERTQAEMTKTTDHLFAPLIITYSLSVLALLFGTFSVFYFRRELMRPIRSLMKQVRVVSTGTFTHQIQYEVKDEFYELAQEFNRMSRNIAELFENRKEQAQILRQILDSLPVGVITRYLNNSDPQINSKARQLVQLDEDHFPILADGSNWSEIAHDEDTLWFENRKLSLLGKDGLPFVALVSYAPLVSHDGQRLGSLIVLTDITEQEKVQEFINQSEKLTLAGQLAAGAAHEIRNPLTVIYGFMQLMQSKLSPENQEEFHLPLILSEIERVNRIVTELLMLSKPSKPNYRKVALKDILSSIIPLMQGEASLHNIQIVEDYDKHATLHVDIEQMKQILLNLMKNSVEAMPEGGTLTISSRTEGDFLQLSVSDTGVGISPEHLNRIFDPFFSMKEEGTGLGLSISHRMVKNHGGDIFVTSEEGMGTTVTISLPMRPA